MNSRAFSCHPESRSPGRRLTLFVRNTSINRFVREASQQHPTASSPIEPSSNSTYTNSSGRVGRSLVRQSQNCRAGGKSGLRRTESARFPSRATRLVTPGGYSGVSACSVGMATESATENIPPVRGMASASEPVAVIEAGPQGICRRSEAKPLSRVSSLIALGKGEMVG